MPQVTVTLKPWWSHAWEVARRQGMTKILTIKRDQTLPEGEGIWMGSRCRKYLRAGCHFWSHLEDLLLVDTCLSIIACTMSRAATELWYTIGSGEWATKHKVKLKYKRVRALYFKWQISRTTANVLAHWLALQHQAWACSEDSLQSVLKCLCVPSVLFERRNCCSDTYTYIYLYTHTHARTHIHTMMYHGIYADVVVMRTVV